MSAVDWKFLKSESDIEEKAKLFTGILVSIVQEAFLERTCRRKSNLQHNIDWFNDHLRNMRQTLTLMQDAYRRTESIALKPDIKVYRYQYRFEISQIKANDRYIARSESTSRASWQVVNKYGANKLNNTCDSAPSPNNLMTSL